ncbi:methyl-accepting chemotaxis protein [Paraburkholderia ferrariae]|uniref:methyl-accepting chemotaxis protein n=1 Tax=Paraburkholderia ferrariae TaxID=386056 RepID=UPI0004863E24|nr:methyl-accepting chemotaxis protein [Paraburkholderia ferrariae]
MSRLTGTIKLKIALAFAACIALMIAIGLMSMRGLATLSSDMRSMYTDGAVPMEDLAATQTSSLRMRTTFDRLVIQHDPAQAKPLVDHARELEQKMATSWSDYYPGRVTDDDERKVADRIASLMADYKSQFDPLLASAEAGKLDASDPAIGTLSSVSSALSDAINEDIGINAGQIKSSAAEGNDTFHTLLYTAIALLTAGLIVGIGAWRYLSRAITGPLATAMTAAQRIADGQLEGAIDVRTNDEFGRLLQALRQMDAQLAEIVRGVKTSSESILVASGEIAAGNMDLSSRTEEQAASLEETAASMEELTATVKQNSDNARQATTLATNASQIADKGAQVVEAMLATMTEINSSSTKIADITGLIESIAFQTNILALNAAVEAARAGEQGRGFAVVAGEVRSLAQRASSAAKEIKDLIHSSVSTIHEGSTQAEEVGRTMGDVQQAIRRVADINAEISAASEEQSRGIEQVNCAVGQMDEVTQQNAALVEEASAAAQSLEQQAAQQKRAISVFKLANDRGAAAVAAVPAAAVKTVARAPALSKPVRPAAPRAVSKPVPAPVPATAAAGASAGASSDWETF